MFSPQEETRFPLFINSVIADKSRGLFNLCEMLWRAFSSGPCTLRVDVYASAPAIRCRMQQEYWSEPLFQEDTGMDLQTLNAVCHMAQDEPLYRALLVGFLNHHALMLT